MVHVELFATNLNNASHMEWANDGRLLVNEHSAGTIKDITHGGDMKDVAPVAHGLKGPAGILPMPDGRLLVAETWGGTIRDVSTGGDVSQRPPFAVELSMPYSMVVAKKDGASRLFVSECQDYRSSWVTDFTEGGGRRSHAFYAKGLPTLPGSPGVTPAHIENWPQNWQNYAAGQYIRMWQEGGIPLAANIHFVSVGPLGQIIDLSSGGGTYSELLDAGRVFAWGLGRIGGIKMHPTNGLLYGTEPENGVVFAVDPKVRRNYRFDPPVVRGLVKPTCLRFSADGQTMYVCGQGEGVVWRITDF